MADLITTETIPIHTDSDGVIRVSNTRVPLADVYSMIGYYLHNRTEMDAYLVNRQAEAQKIQNENEARYNPVGIRERLLAKQTAN